MLDIRLLLLVIPEDRFAPNPAFREAEALLFPLVAMTRGERSDAEAAQPEEVTI